MTWWSAAVESDVAPVSPNSAQSREEGPASPGGPGWTTRVMYWCVSKVHTG